MTFHATKVWGLLEKNYWQQEKVIVDTHAYLKLGTRAKYLFCLWCHHCGRLVGHQVPDHRSPLRHRSVGHWVPGRTERLDQKYFVDHQSLKEVLVWKKKKLFFNGGDQNEIVEHFRCRCLRFPHDGTGSWKRNKRKASTNYNSYIHRNGELCF